MRADRYSPIACCTTRSTSAPSTTRPTARSRCITGTGPAQFEALVPAYADAASVRLWVTPPSRKSPVRAGPRTGPVPPHRSGTRRRRTTSGASDGAIGSTTKIVDHGSHSSRWDLVILGDGYRAGRARPVPHRCAGFSIASALRRRTTSSGAGQRLAGRRHLHRQRGRRADRLRRPGRDAARPIFDATFCSLWGTTRLERLLTVDSALADAAALAAVPLRNQTLVIVNSAKYGGSGGAIATCSTNARSPRSRSTRSATRPSSSPTSTRTAVRPVAASRWSPTSRSTPVGPPTSGVT